MQRGKKSTPVTANRPAGSDGAAPAVSAAAAISLLKQTRGMLTWTVHHLQKALLTTASQTRDILAAFELQGYIKRSAENANEWLTTLNGEGVSRSSPPRFAREGVEKSLALLRERINQLDADRNSPYSVARAVAFGDFLVGGAQVQAADLGIQLSVQGESARNAKNAREFLKKLRARDSRLKLIAYEPWMSARSYLDLLRAKRAGNSAKSQR